MTERTSSGRRFRHAWRHVGLLLIACAAGCAEPAVQRSSPTVVGVVLPLSGPHAPTGRGALLGLEWAVAAASPAYELRILDGAGDALISVRAAQQLALDPEIDVLVGGWRPASARAIAAWAAAEEWPVPFVALSPRAAPEFPEGAGISLHRVEALGRAAAVWLHRERGATRTFVVEDPKSPASMRLAGAFVAAFTALGGEVSPRLEVGDDGRLRRLREPVAAVGGGFVATPWEAAARLDRVDAKLAQAPVVVPAGWDPAAVLIDAARQRELYRVSFWSEGDPRPAAAELRRVAEETGHTLTSAIAFGWDAFRLIDAAARNREPGQSLESFDWSAGLNSVTGVDGASGPLVGRGDRGTMHESPAIERVTVDGDSLLTRVDVRFRPWDDARKAP